MTSSKHETQQSGLICAYLLDGKGGGKSCDWDQVLSWKPSRGPLWVHLDYTGSESRRWLEEDSTIDEITRAALLAADPRPRSVTTETGMLLILRGVNMNEGAQPEDMVSIRIYLSSQRVVSLRHRRNKAAKEVRNSIEAGRGPKRVGHFLTALIDNALEQIGLVSDGIDERVASLEDEVLASDSFEQRHQLADARRRAIALRRHVAPERDVLLKLHTEPAGWLTQIDRARLRELADRMTRIIEDIDSARERAAVTQEEVANRLSELMNKRLYVLSIITAVFLPLGVITSLFGLNVGGMPLQNHPLGFAMVSGGITGLIALMMITFKLLKWI
jgi:zinc transporter